MKKNKFHFYDSPETIYRKLMKENLKPEQVSDGVERIIEIGNSYWKDAVLRNVPNLSKKDINRLVSSVSYEDGRNIFDICFSHIDKLDESTESYIIKEYLNFEVNYFNFDLHYGNLLNQNLRLSSVRLIAEHFLNLGDINILIYLLMDEKFSEYYDLFIEKIFEIGNISALVAVLTDYSSLLGEKVIRKIITYLGTKNAKTELIELIEDGIVESEHFDYIISILAGFNNLTLEDIEDIPIDVLSTSSRHILTALYCKLGTSQDILAYYESNMCLDKEDDELIIKRLCELKDKDVLIRIIRILNFERVVSYHDDIFKALSQIADLLYSDISEIDFRRLTNDNKDSYVDIVCQSSTPTSYLYNFVNSYKEDLNSDYIDKIVRELCKRLDAKYIYKTSKIIENLSSDNISNLVEALSKTNSAKYMYKFAKNIKNLSKEDISILTKAISKTDDIEYIYLFLKNVPNIKNEDRKLLKSKILNSHNMKFICLVALYIDTKLIKRLFYSKKQMYRYMVSSNLFNKKELLDISLNMFGGYIDVTFIDMLVKDEINKTNIKIYKNTIKNELNKKDTNKKDNKKGNK